MYIRSKAQQMIIMEQFDLGILQNLFWKVYFEDDRLLFRFASEHKG